MVKYVKLLILIVIIGCASKVQLPTNAVVNNDQLDKVDFSFVTQNVADFSKLKLCVAKNLTNNTVNLEDAAGSFVGPYTGNYYQLKNKQYAFGGDVFKLVDERSSSIIADGITSYIGDSLGLIKQFVKFEVETSIKDKNLTLLFFNITRAQQNTGFLENSGFSPVTIWYGVGAPDVYKSLELVANNIKYCIR